MLLMVFMGSSPDGLVHDPLESSYDGLVEAKHITVNSWETLRDALLRKGICKLVGGQKMKSSVFLPSTPANVLH